MGNFIIRVIAWPLLIALHVLVCLLLLLWLLLGTNYGTQEGLAAAARWLPLSYESVSGNALKQLHLQGLKYEDESIALSVEELRWSLKLDQLWQQQPLLQIESMAVRQASIKLKDGASEPSKQAQEPFALQAITLPLSVQLDSLRLEDIELQYAGETYALKQLRASASLSDNGKLSVDAELKDGPFASQARLSATAHMTDAAAQASIDIAHATARWDNKPFKATGRSQLLYNGSSLHISAEALRASYDSAEIELNGELAPQKTLAFQVQVPSLQLASSELGGSVRVNGSIKNAERLFLEASVNQLSWLGEPQLESASINWQGSLAEQTLNAQLYSDYWGQQVLSIESQFGWRDSFAALQQASTLAPEALLAHAALHFHSTVTLAQAEIAATGVSLKNNQLSVRLLDNGELAIDGSSQSGDGSIALAGTLQLIDSATQEVTVNAQLTGEQYQLAKTPELTLSASPNINISLAQQQLTLRGNVTIDNGHIEIILPKASAIRASDDVVFIDEPLAAEQASALKRDIQLKLIIEQPLTIKGQGFDGSATGQLTITERHGQQPRARGELLLAGRYKAYGQDLSIRRGKLIYVDSPIDDPGVDLEAIRTVKDQIAGVRVSGLASNPKISIFAEPALSETEALSYLVLGRGLDANNERDQNQLRNLALSLGLSKGGKFLEKSKGKLGVDELSIQTGDSNNDASLLVGRQLSKRLYLSTQIGLFEPVTKLLLRYNLSRKCDLVAETGTQQGADIVCTMTSGAN